MGLLVHWLPSLYIQGFTTLEEANDLLALVGTREKDSNEDV